MDTLDLVQLHCLPTQAYYMPELFEALDELVADGSIAHYGVSVEKVEEGLKALEYPGVATVQIVFNAFRQRPAERFLDEALRRDVGVLARVPLASRAAHRQAHPRHRVRGGRPPAVQPAGRVVRPGRDVRGRGLRDGARGGRGAPGARAGRRDAGPARAPLDPHAPRRHDDDPGREDARPGASQRRRRGPRAARRRDDGPDPRRSTTRTSGRSSTSAGRRVPVATSSPSTSRARCSPSGSTASRSTTRTRAAGRSRCSPARSPRPTAPTARTSCSSRAARASRRPGRRARPAAG